MNQRGDEGTYPNIDDFLEFLEGATLEMSDPVFGVKESKGRSDNKESKNQSKPKTSNFAVKAEPKQANVAKKKAESSFSEFRKPNYQCVLCDAANLVYMERPYDSFRWSWLRIALTLCVFREQTF